MNIVYTVVLALAAVNLGSCYCPLSGMNKLGNCSYQIYCYQDVSGLRLPMECQYSDYPTSVKLVLRNPVVFNNTNVDIKMVTSFEVQGKWPQENLAIIERMYALRELRLVDNHIERIEGNPFNRLYNLEIIDLSHNRLSNIENLLKIETQPSKLQKLILAYNDIDNIPANVFESLTSLEELDLSHNAIKNLNSHSFNNICRLRLLSLAYNNIDSIPDDTFDNVTSLEQLDLSNNSISELNNNSFSNLPRLTVLKLNNNKIIDLDGAINTLDILKHLYLRGNQIKYIDMHSVGVIFHLETFDVSSNQLENIALEMFARHWPHFNSNSRCRIMLSDNYLTHLSNATLTGFMERVRNAEDQKLDVETELDLSKNSITTIEPYAFQYAFHLSSLDLSRNKLTTFTIHANDLRHIKYLNLSNNLIRNLDYDSFLSMDNLQNLDLSFNQLENIDARTFLTNNVLRFVNISDNSLRDITNLYLKFDPVGGVLDLTKNSLSAINIPQENAISLVMLILRSNTIADTSLVELRQQNELKYLDMGNNYIKWLNESSLRLPSSLEYFDLTFNEIEFIAPSVFQDLRHLHTLRLSHNLIQHIEYGAFRSLTALKDLDLSYNEIPILDSKVFTELKSLQVLSVRENGMYYLDYKSWIGHKYFVRVNMDGNSFDCQWLAAAITDYSNGISRMEPATTEPVKTGNNLRGISCVENAPQALMDGLDSDRALLVIASNILEVVREQTKILREQFGYEAPSLRQIGSRSYNSVK